jgi:site-specific DNA-methyltransferase (adenine-specific)
MININEVYNLLCLDGMKKLNNKSIDSIITSPPYWQLRDYGFSEQWGLEPTYKEYLEHLWQFMDEAYRVLKDEGTCWINLGDTYGGSSGGYYPKDNEVGARKHQLHNRDKVGIEKCLMLIPHRFAIGCIDRGWILRNDIIWAKRNGMPESVKDRFSKKHEFIFFFVKQKKYYFDLDSIREEHSQSTKQRVQYNTGYSKKYQNEDIGQSKGIKKHILEKGKNPGDISDFWDITIKGSRDNHYAAYNKDLIMKPILAGCPENGIVLDPFAGTGQTLKVAYNMNRNFIGFDGNKKYCEIANKYIKDIKNNLFDNV